jgi:peptide deformylase
MSYNKNMTILKIVQYPDPRLRRVGAYVDDLKSERVQKIIDDMLETLAATESCGGLSATQLDIDLPPQIAVINNPFEPGGQLCLVNPTIIASEGSVAIEEGCMSIYPSEISAVVERAKWVKVKALNRFGESIEIEAEEYVAKLLQHEIDHLMGKIYLDKISRLKRSRIEKKVAKLILHQQYSSNS